jgi:uridine kinase
MFDTKEIFNSVLKAINENRIGIIGIDGLGGAGKSTICEKVCQDFEENNYHTILLHIDDFIHVRDVRYNSAYPDWHCYYELQWRFDYFSSIINKIKNSNEAYIDIELYDKDNDTYFLERYEIHENTIVIVEGVFLQRKEYHDIFDYMIYLDIPEEIRLQRVLKRDTYIGNEQQIIDKYKNRYFPAEHRYIEENQPQKNADFIIGE